MFDHQDSGVGLLPGERPEDFGAEDRLAFEVTCRELAGGPIVNDRHVLPDLESMVPGLFLHAVLASLDRSRLNGFDLVEVLRARERLVAHLQAGSVADAYEMAHAAPGAADADPERTELPDEFAADELRPALGITRNAADLRMSVAFDLCERLPRVWELLSGGLIDLSRARVIANGTAHLSREEARRVVEMVAERASRLTTGQLAAWIRRLCVESDPERAQQRVEHAREQRAFTVEPTEDGTANVHLWDIDILDARAIGRRVNGLLISHRKDGDLRSHDQLRADIATDLLLGSDPANRGRGTIQVNVDLTSLAGWDDKAAEIPGMGPVVADIARQYADRHPKAAWQAVIRDDQGNVVDVVTTSRRPSSQISRLVNATQPVCAFPGCRIPAADCDYDHLQPHSQHGPTSVANGGPKCRHDHVLKDKGWNHRRLDGQDIWKSPLGHTYITEKPP